MSVIKVRLVNDYGGGWPVWFDDIFDDEDIAPLSDSLKEEIQEWANLREKHMGNAHMGLEFYDPQKASELNVMGRKLAVRVAAELGPKYKVYLRLERSDRESSGWITKFN